MRTHSIRRKPSQSRQAGYVLIVMMLFLSLMAIGLAAIAPAIGQQIRRERESELTHRGRQYARAIRLYYRRFGRYPVSLDNLDNTNNMRFLRKRFKDPMTAGGDWRIIHFGEARAVLPKNAPLLPGATVLGASNNAPGGFGSGAGSAPGPGPSAQPQSNDPSQPGSPSSGQPGDPSAQPGGPILGGGAIVGVSSTSKKESIKELDGQNHYKDWEFVYDPRLDMGVQPGMVPTGPPLQGAPGVPLPPGTVPPGSTAPSSTPGPSPAPKMQ
jgi:type II secretory pathway pseudopilin PulG